MFNGPPFFEDWNEKTATAELEYSKNQQTFRGLVLSREPIGLTWGYLLPQKNSGRVDYETICDALETYNMDSNTFYLSEVAIRQEDRGKGYGSLLVKNLDDIIDEKNIVFRTKNPAMVAVGKKVWGEPVFVIDEESSYSGGEVYGFRK